MASESPENNLSPFVVAFVELAHQVVACLAFDLLGCAQEQHGGATVGLLVDLVDDAMAYRHFVYLR